MKKTDKESVETFNTFSASITESMSSLIRSSDSLLQSQKCQSFSCPSSPSAGSLWSNRRTAVKVDSKQMDDLEKENFHLRLQVQFLKIRLLERHEGETVKQASHEAEAVKQKNDLQAQNERLQRELKSKETLLDRTIKIAKQNNALYKKAEKKLSVMGLRLKNSSKEGVVSSIENIADNSEKTDLIERMLAKDKKISELADKLNRFKCRVKSFENAAVQRLRLAKHHKCKLSSALKEQKKISEEILVSFEALNKELEVQRMDNMEVQKVLSTKDAALAFYVKAREDLAKMLEEKTSELRITKDLQKKLSSEDFLKERLQFTVRQPSPQTDLVDPEEYGRWDHQGMPEPCTTDSFDRLQSIRQKPVRPDFDEVFNDTPGRELTDRSFEEQCFGPIAYRHSFDNAKVLHRQLQSATTQDLESMSEISLSHTDLGQFIGDSRNTIRNPLRKLPSPTFRSNWASICSDKTNLKYSRGSRSSLI